MKKLIIETIIQHCGECFYAENNICEKTGYPIDNYWNGVLPNCPLDSVDDDKYLTNTYPS